MTDTPRNTYGEPYESLAYCRKKVLENMQWAFDLYTGGKEEISTKKPEPKPGEFGSPYEAIAYARKKVLEKMQWAFDLYRR